MLNELLPGKNSSFGDFSTYAFIKEEKFPVPAAVAQRWRRDGKASKLFRLGPIILWFRLDVNENGLISKIRTKAVKGHKLRRW